MNLDNIFDKALNRERLTREEAIALWNAPLPKLAAAADQLRCKSVDDPSVVTWQIKRVRADAVCLSRNNFIVSTVCLVILLLLLSSSVGLINGPAH